MNTFIMIIIFVLILYFSASILVTKKFCEIERKIEELKKEIINIKRDIGH